MLRLLVLAFLSSMVSGTLHHHNSMLIDTMKYMTDNLVKMPTEDNDPNKVYFTQLLYFNQKFVESILNEPDKENIFAYTRAYKGSVNIVREDYKSKPASQLARPILDNLDEFNKIIGERVAFVDKNCDATDTVESDKVCEAKLKVFDDNKETSCPGYSAKVAKLHYMSLQYIQSIHKMVMNYNLMSRQRTVIALEFLQLNALPNAYALVPLSVNYHFMKMNTFTCFRFL